MKLIRTRTNQRVWVGLDVAVSCAGAPVETVVRVVSGIIFPGFFRRPRLPPRDTISEFAPAPAYPRRQNQFPPHGEALEPARRYRRDDFPRPIGPRPDRPA